MKVRVQPEKGWLEAMAMEFFTERDARGAQDRLVIGLEVVAEKAEVLTDLWRDLAAAHAARR